MPERLSVCCLFKCDLRVAVFSTHTCVGVFVCVCLCVCVCLRMRMCMCVCV